MKSICVMMCFGALLIGCAEDHECIVTNPVPAPIADPDVVNADIGPGPYNIEYEVTGTLFGQAATIEYTQGDGTVWRVARTPPWNSSTDDSLVLTFNRGDWIVLRSIWQPASSEIRSLTVNIFVNGVLWRRSSVTGNTIIATTEAELK